MIHSAPLGLAQRKSYVMHINYILYLQETNVIAISYTMAN